MARTITPQTSLENLKKEAKRFLKALRAGDAEALARYRREYPNGPAKPALRHVQHAIALHFGKKSWTELKKALADRPTEAAPAAPVADTPERRVAQFLEFACPDHHVRGGPAHRMARHAAMRLLEAHPEIARANLYTAIVCGEVDEVARILRERPELAREKSAAASAERTGVGGSEDLFHDIGAKGWEPLLYLAFTRLPLAKTNDNAVAMARLLLDHGADPKSYFMAGDSQYTPLVGVIGEGEEDRPPHPRRDELARILLERGANPYDNQVVYNIHFHGNVLWFLQLAYEFSMKAGRKADWDDPAWRMFDMGGYGNGARWHLWIAIRDNSLGLAQWCLEHGADPNAPPPRAKNLWQQSLHEHALLAGEIEIAELLARFGAQRVELEAESESAFVAACFRLDRDAARALVARHPEHLQTPRPLKAAAQQDRADVLAFLLDLGMSPDLADDNGATALHDAAYKGAPSAVTLLIERGAKIDPVEKVHDATPLWFAMWSNQERTVELLAPHSVDLWALSFTGHVARIRELLTAHPEWAKWSGPSTPLHWLPEDERAAAEIVDLFVANGADAGFRRKSDGLTAAEIARRRGLTEAAKKLEAAAAGPGGGVSGPRDGSHYEQLARDLVNVFASGEAEALARANAHFAAKYSAEDIHALVHRLIYKVRRAKGAAEAFQLEEAKELICRVEGYPNWEILLDSVAAGKPAPVPAFQVNAKADRLALKRLPSPSDWDTIVGVMKEHRIPELEAGMMTDEAMRRVAELDFVTSLNVEGSRGLTDSGLQFLARMPQLRNLNVTGCKITDRGLEVLQHLPNLREFSMYWQKGVSDAGVAHLRACEQIEAVNLMGSTLGDGAVEALRGKTKLRVFRSGAHMTDAGLRMLREFPVFRTWQGREVEFDLMNLGEDPNLLVIDGPVTDRGLAGLTELEGLAGLVLFWHVKNASAQGLAALPKIPHLLQFRCDGELVNDESMRYIAAAPQLRFLLSQGSAATDDGFAALSQSRTLEQFWGREAPGLGGRGFRALARMPKLRGLGVSLAQVDDDALAVLPQFPALRELTPIDVNDHGFRHVGKCERLERLWCMYCRDTTDVATEHIAKLRLKYYYAGLTGITDRSLEILGRMQSLEKIEFYECKSVTDAGLPFLAKLPKLREVDIFGMPKVTPAGIQVFPEGIRVNYGV